MQSHGGRRRRRRRPAGGAPAAALAGLAALAWLQGALAFNLDPQSALVHAGPRGSYFGFSVAQHRDRGVAWLLVGAPRAQTDQARVERAGAVYRCAPNNAAACQQIPFDPNGSSVIQLRAEARQSDDKSNQGFGASLASAHDNGSIIACAPNYVYYSTNLRRRDPVGTCWVSRGSFGGFLEYSPCRINDQWGHHHLGSCQAGFSSAITRDGGRIYMGAPGSHVWQGQTFAHSLRTDLSNATSAVNPHTEDDSYQGYSLALGRFSGQAAPAAPAGPSRPGGPGHEQADDLAIGMPRANDLAGQVMLVDRELRPLRNLTGDQMGAYFGYALAAADLNGDGLDDLLVGAPLYYNASISHKEPHFERGRVYVFLQGSERRGHFRLASQLDGAANRARFGSALANCGDLNRDGLADVAIGAPYDGPQQRGAVYIFMGRHKLGLAPEPDQVIYAESVRGEGALLRAFGFSLSGGLDLDANQYPDLLVGDYASDRAVLLRSRPVVNLVSSISFKPEHFNLDDKSCLLPNNSTAVSCIQVTYCLKYSGLNVDPWLAFVFDVKLDTENNKAAPRLFFLAPGDPTRSEEQNTDVLTKDNNKCHSFKAYIMRHIRDKLTPLRIDVDVRLAPAAGPSQSEASQADSQESAAPTGKLRPVLSKLSQASHMSRVAMIQKNCGQDNVCVPDLKLTMASNLDRYTAGSDERLVLDVSVRNAGEDAYEASLFLQLPSNINFIKINRTRPNSPECDGPRPEQSGLNMLTCDLGNPLAHNELVRFQVITEPASQLLADGSQAAPFAAPDFTFMANVNSTNPEKDERHREDNQAIVGIPIRVETNLVLSGSSSPPLIVHNSTVARLAAGSRGQQASSGGWPLMFGLGAPEPAGSDLWGFSADGQQQQPQQELQPAPSERPKLTELEAGREVYHLYQLQNRGQSTIEDIALTIIWPSKTKDGDFLLYLVDEPLTSANVRCKPAPEAAINPLQLKYVRGNGPQLAGQANSSYLAAEYAALRRFRRQSAPPAAQAAQPSAASSVDSAAVQQLAANCGPSQCARFECNVAQLAHNQIATIKIRARLWHETLNKLNMQEYDISSKLVAQIKALPYNVSVASLPPYVYKVETQVHTTGMAMQDLLPWWLIALAVLLGTGLFVLLACFLNYLGFFARRRPPKGAEREPLTPTMWNDYQFSPGDTAL